MAGNLLKTLIFQRRWQTFELFAPRFQSAAAELAEMELDSSLRNTPLSPQEFVIWLAGHNVRPSNAQRLVLEHLFDLPIERLLADDDDQTFDTSMFDSKAPVDLAKSIESAYEFLNASQRDHLSQGAIDQLHQTARRLAGSYPTTSVVSMLSSLQITQAATLGHINTSRTPSESRDLNFIGGILSGLLSKASHDLGEYSAAMTHARVAALCAERAGHNELLGWVFAIQSLTKYWAQDPYGAAELAQRGAEYVSGLNGSVSIWLPALEARAHAVVGNEGGVIAATERAAEVRQRQQKTELDEIGGLMGFSHAKELYYVSEAAVLLGRDGGESIRLTEEALDSYNHAPVHERDVTSEAGARCNLALAYAQVGDVTAAMKTLGPVLELDELIDTHGVNAAITRVDDALRLVDTVDAIAARSQINHARFMSPFKQNEAV